MVLGPAYGQDVTIGNLSSAVYLFGSEFVDGSVRLLPSDELEGVPHIELRTDGVWANTGLALNAGTLFLGNDISIGTVGSHLQINSEEGVHKSILLETRFDDVGTGLPHTHTLGPRINRVVFVPNESGEIVTSLFELPVTSFLTAFRYTYYFKSGSVAATFPVTMELSKGSTPGGKIIHRAVMPASRWAENVEVAVELIGGLQLSIGAPLLLTIKSDDDFSIIGDGTVTGTFFAMDFQTFFLEDVISIPTGTDRFMVTNAGQIMLDNFGHPIFLGKQGSLDTTTPAPAFPPLSDPPPPGI